MQGRHYQLDLDVTAQMIPELLIQFTNDEDSEACRVRASIIEQISKQDPEFAKAMQD